MSKLDVIGGIPVMSVIGTPRTMGETIGERCKPQLQVLHQYLSERLTTHANLPERSDALGECLRGYATYAAPHEPSLWMELESIARATGMPIEDLLLVQGFSDLFSFFGCDLPAGQSTFIAFSANQTESQSPCLTLALRVDPALLPYLTLVHRMPAHGPANVSLTFAGLHALAGLSEAGIAVAGNELRVNDGVPGLLTTHLLASTLSAPGLDDALSRVLAGTRYGGRAIHGLSADGDRFSVELTGQRQARLPDTIQSAPRVHTNHPLDEELNRSGTVLVESTSRARLERTAAVAVQATAVRPVDIATWFGVADDVAGDPADAGAQRPSLARDFDQALHAESLVLAVIDPRARELHLRRGLGAKTLDVMKL